MFRSETRRELNAFAGDASGSRLPANHGPWAVTGTIDANKAPPHNFPRAAIEKAIATAGFQLWRMKSDMPAPPPPAAPAAPAKRAAAAPAKRPASPPKRPAAAAPAKRPPASAGRAATKRPAADVKRHAAALAKRRAARA
jgi:hypothetical protein